MLLLIFFEDKYNVEIYHAGVSANDLEKLSVDYDYQDGFNLEKLIQEIDEKIKKHPQSKDTTLMEKKKKLYATIAWISWCLPILICGGSAIYGVITEVSIKVDAIWAVIFIVVPLMVGSVFDLKSKRLK